MSWCVEELLAHKPTGILHFFPFHQASLYFRTQEVAHFPWQRKDRKFWMRWEKPINQHGTLSYESVLPRARILIPQPGQVQRNGSFTLLLWWHCSSCYWDLSACEVLTPHLWEKNTEETCTSDFGQYMQLFFYFYFF